MVGAFKDIRPARRKPACSGNRRENLADKENRVSDEASDHPRHGLRQFAASRLGALTLVTLVFILLAAAGEIVVQLDLSRREQAVHALATAAASNVRARLESELSSTLFLTSGLVAYVSSIDAQLDEAHVTALLSSLYRNGRNVRNIAIAPANRVRWVYPLQGNEKVLGLYYPDNPTQWPAVRSAMLARTTLVAGPLELVQGGTALIARTPVFRTDLSYWGLLSMVIDWESLKHNAGLLTQQGGFRFAIRGRDGTGERGPVFFGDEAVFAEDPVTMTLTLPGGTWRIGVAPVSGWHRAAAAAPWARPTYLALALVIAALFYGMMRDWAERASANAQLKAFNATLEERVLARTQALQAVNDELAQALATLRDTQQELVRNEKMAALGALVAGVAHELNTPIGNSVLASTTLQHRVAELRDSDGKLTRTQWRAALDELLTASELINASLTRAAQLVASFKQIAADRSSEQRRVFRLDTVVTQTVLMLQPTLRRAGVGVENEVGAVEMDSYPGLIDQLLINLIQNAVMHAFPEGREGLMVITAREEGERVTLTVADDGVGIPPAFIGRVFDPFFTTRLGRGGTGLGLHIVHNVVTGPLGGRIAVHSEPGAGTRFEIVLLKRAAPAESGRLAVAEN